MRPFSKMRPQHPSTKHRNSKVQSNRDWRLIHPMTIIRWHWPILLASIGDNRHRIRQAFRKYSNQMRPSPQPTITPISNMRRTKACKLTNTVDRKRRIWLRKRSKRLWTVWWFRISRLPRPAMRWQHAHQHSNSLDRLNPLLPNGSCWLQVSDFNIKSIKW